MEYYKRVLTAFFLISTIFSMQALAMVELQKYEVTPSSVKPGTKGALVLTFSNSSFQPYRSSTLEARGPFIEKGYYEISPLGYLSSTILTLPFEIPESTNSGVYQITFYLHYSVSDGYYSKTISIPLTVSNEPEFIISTNSISTDKIKAGQEVGVKIKLKNEGGIAKRIYLNSNSNQFYLTSVNQIFLGDLNSGQEKEIELSFTSNTSLYTNSIPIVLNYLDELGQSKEKELKIPLNLNRMNLEIKKVEITPSDYSSGDEIKINIVLLNQGEAISGISACVSSNLFEEQCKFIGFIEKGESTSINFNALIPEKAVDSEMKIKIVGDLGKKEEKIPLTIHKKIARLSVSRIKSEPTVLKQGSKGTLEIRIENYGKGEAKNVRTTLSIDGSKYDAIVGKIDGEDRANANFYIPLILAGGIVKAKLAITFEDSRGTQFVEEEIPLSIEEYTSSNPFLIPGIIVIAILAYVFRKRIAKALKELLNSSK